MKHNIDHKWQVASSRPGAKLCDGCKKHKFDNLDMVLVTEQEVSCMRGDDIVKFFCVNCASAMNEYPPIKLTNSAAVEQYRIACNLPSRGFTQAKLLEHFRRLTDLVATLQVER